MVQAERIGRRGLQASKVSIMPKGLKGQKRPRDPNLLGKLIVDISVGEVEDLVPEGAPKNEAAAELGRKGGKARAERMSAGRRKDIAQKAAQKRWGKP